MQKCSQGREVSEIQLLYFFLLIIVHWRVGYLLAKNRMSEYLHEKFYTWEEVRVKRSVLFLLHHGLNAQPTTRRCEPRTLQSFTPCDSRYVIRDQHFENPFILRVRSFSKNKNLN